MNYEKKISFCMIIKNEEKNLNRTLKVLSPILEIGLAELIIVDTGSEDNSLEIANRYTAKVYKHKWNDNFAEMRNISISYAQGEWIFILDADEEIENPDELIAFFKKDISKYNTISVKIKNYIESKMENKERVYNLGTINRCFRNNKQFKYEGAIHEQPLFLTPVIPSQIILGHSGYIWEDKDFIEMKYDRTTTILKKEIKKNPKNVYYQYQLAVSESIVNRITGLREIRKTYELIKKENSKKKAQYLYVYGLYARIALANLEYIETLKISEEGLGISKDYIDLWYHKAMSENKIGDDDSFIKSALEFLSCKKRFFSTSIFNDPAFTFYHLDDKSEEEILYELANTFLKFNKLQDSLEYGINLKNKQLKSKWIIDYTIKTQNKEILLNYITLELKEKNSFKHFIQYFEQKLLSAQKYLSYEDIISIYNKNNFEEDEYYLLNLMRQNKCVEKEKLIYIFNDNFQNFPEYYGDMIVYIMKNNLDISIFSNIVSFENLDIMIHYLKLKKEYSFEVVNKYLFENNKPHNISANKVWILFAKNILTDETIEVKETEYRQLFEKYLINGYKLITDIYNEKVLKENQIQNLDSNEHKFFFYMGESIRVKEDDEKKHIKLLRKALKVFPMKRAIKLFLQDIQDNSNKENKNEFEEYKLIVKKNIGILIEAKKINEAKVLIEEYLKIVPNDLEMLTLKSEIQLQLM